MFSLYGCGAMSWKSPRSRPLPARRSGPRPPVRPISAHPRGGAATAAGLASSCRASPRVRGALIAASAWATASAAFPACRARWASPTWVRSQARRTRPSPPSQGWKWRPSRTDKAWPGTVGDQQAGELDRQVVPGGHYGSGLIEPVESVRHRFARPLRELVALVPEPAMAGGQLQGPLVGRRRGGRITLDVERGHRDIAPDHRVRGVQLSRATPGRERIRMPFAGVEPVAEEGLRPSVGIVRASAAISATASSSRPGKLQVASAAAPGVGPQRPQHGHRSGHAIAARW